MLDWKTAGTKLYQQLPSQLRDTLKACEPLREVPKDRKIQENKYKTWNENKEA
jgi:hypothetical protein